jgi:5-methylcytosine-specific restriction endonuclease McrA
MPIKPENRARYPRHWKQIRAAILDRARHCCEFCGVRNYSVGYWDGDKFCRHGGNGPCDFAGDGQCWPSGELLSYSDACEFREAANEWREPGEPRTHVIVLTIAHLDHTPENCDPANLRALCNRCHLAYDAKHHAQTAYQTRRAGKAKGDLFDAALES